jgi:hypothetical protein
VLCIDIFVGYTNTSNIFRIKSLIPNGFCSDEQGRAVEQTVHYYRSAPDGPTRIERLKDRSLVAYYEAQIKSIVKEVCNHLEEARDELFLYGFGRGAWIVRAVAGVLDAMWLPKSTSLRYFDRLYQSALDMLKARKEDDNRNGPQIVEFLRSHSARPPRIQLLCAIDTVKYSAEGHAHDISFVPSILNLRHALAINETKSLLSLETYAKPTVKDMTGRTFIQAWFLGSHQDLGGGALEDGLSFYPLQWILIESIRAGLALRNTDKPATSSQASILRLVFPQYVGDLPKLNSGEMIEWQIDYSNKAHVSMFDLHSTHLNQAHTIHINLSNPLYNNPRKTFSSRALIGWDSEGTYLHRRLGQQLKWGRSIRYHHSPICTLLA